MMTFFRDLVQRNLPTKILALIVAVVMWFFVMNDQNPTMDGSFTIPISYVGEPSDYYIAHATDTVKIKVRGQRSLFVSAEKSDFTATVNLDDFKEGVGSYAVATSIPYGLELLEVRPDRVEVTLEPIIERSVPVEIMLTGSPQEGMTVYNIIQRAGEVAVSGPKSAVEEIARVIGYFNLANESSDITRSVNLMAVNYSGREIAEVSILPGEIEATVQLARGLTRKIVTIEPTFTSSLPRGMRMKSIVLQPNKIEIAGTEEVLADISSIKTDDIVLSDILGNVTQRVKLKLPVGITVTSDEVIADIELEDIRTNDTANN